MKLTFDELQTAYADKTTSVICKCEFQTSLAGGQPASPDGVEQYVKHHLGLEGAEAEQAISRILQEEIGERPVPSENGELEERISYGINIIRRTKFGPYLGNWMIQACAKQAASRLGIFSEKRGTKGDLSEGGMVSAHGISLIEPDHSDRIYLSGPDGNPAVTSFQKFQGRVQTPRGSKSVVHDTEIAPPGTRFEFRFQFLGKRLNNDDIKDFLALAMVVGLGSCKSLGCGRFRIIEADID